MENEFFAALMKTRSEEASLDAHGINVSPKLRDRTLRVTIVDRGSVPIRLAS
jgi:hypothetical protein